MATSAMVVLHGTSPMVTAPTMHPTTCQDLWMKSASPTWRATPATSHHRRPHFASQPTRSPSSQRPGQGHMLFQLIGTTTETPSSALVVVLVVLEECLALPVVVGVVRVVTLEQ